METIKYSWTRSFVPNSEQQRPLEDYVFLCNRLSPSDEDVVLCEAEKAELKIKLLALWVPIEELTTIELASVAEKTRILVAACNNPPLGRKAIISAA